MLQLRILLRFLPSFALAALCLDGVTSSFTICKTWIIASEQAKGSSCIPQESNKFHQLELTASLLSGSSEQAQYNSRGITCSAQLSLKALKQLVRYTRGWAASPWNEGFKVIFATCENHHPQSPKCVNFAEH